MSAAGLATCTKQERVKSSLNTCTLEANSYEVCIKNVCGEMHNSKAYISRPGYLAQTSSIRKMRRNFRLSQRNDSRQTSQRNDSHREAQDTHIRRHDFKLLLQQSHSLRRQERRQLRPKPNTLHPQCQQC